MTKDVSAGDKPSVYFSTKDIPIAPPSPKFPGITKQLTPSAINNVPNKQK